MRHLTAGLSPAYKEIQALISVDKNLLAELSKDEAFKKEHEKLIALLKQKAITKKEEDQQFFQQLDHAAMISYEHLIASLEAQQEELRSQYEIDERNAEIRDTEDRIRKQQDALLHTHSPAELVAVKQLLKDADVTKTSLQNVMGRYQELVDELDEWEDKYWRPMIQAAAKEAAGELAAHVEEVMAADPAMAPLYAALETHPEREQIAAEMKNANKKLEEDLAERLGNRSSPQKVMSIISGLANQLDKAKTMMKLGSEIIVAGSTYERAQNYEVIAAKHRISARNQNPVRTAANATRGRGQEALEKLHRKCEQAIENYKEVTKEMRDAASRANALGARVKDITQPLEELAASENNRSLEFKKIVPHSKQKK